MSVSPASVNTAEIINQNRSFQLGDSPLVMGDIFSSHTSVAVWQRNSNAQINQYFQAAYPALRLGVRSVFAMDSLTAALAEEMPDADGKQAAIDDIYLVADMLTCLFDCEQVGLRLVALDKAMCPRLHVDNIPVRLVTTYLGPGTEWLPNEYSETQSCGRINPPADDSQIRQMSEFDVGLLKGAAWDDNHPAAIHRSCQLNNSNDKRVLLTLDPL